MPTCSFCTHTTGTAVGNNSVSDQRKLAQADRRSWDRTTDPLIGQQPSLLTELQSSHHGLAPLLSCRVSLPVCASSPFRLMERFSRSLFVFSPLSLFFFFELSPQSCLCFLWILGCCLVQLFDFFNDPSACV